MRRSQCIFQLLKVKLPLCHVGHEGRFHFDAPLCLEQGLFDLRCFVLSCEHRSSCSTIKSMPSSCANASSMTTSAVIQLSPVSCLKKHPPCRFFCNDEVACRVEDRVSIVCMCTPMLALRSSEVNPVQTAVPLLSPHQLFPIVLPWFRPTPGSATNCGSSVSDPCTTLTES